MRKNTLFVVDSICSGWSLSQNLPKLLADPSMPSKIWINRNEIGWNFVNFYSKHIYSPPNSQNCKCRALPFPCRRWQSILWTLRWPIYANRIAYSLRTVRWNQFISIIWCFRRVDDFDLRIIGWCNWTSLGVQEDATAACFEPDQNSISHELRAQLIFINTNR